MNPKIILIASSVIFSVSCGQKKAKVNNNNPDNESAIIISDEVENEPKEVWALISMKGTSKEHPDNIQLEEDDIQKFKELYFTFSKDTLIANDKYKALITRDTIDSRKFFRRNYVYDFYIDFFNQNIHSDIFKKLVYMNVGGINEESIAFFKFLNRMNYDDPSPILSNNQIIVSYFGHILIYGKFDEQKKSIPNSNMPLNHKSDDTNTITIDHSYFETHEGTKPIHHYDSEYGEYGITSLNPLGMAESFVYDNMDVSFSIISEIELYDNIRSLIIRGDTEHTLGIWLVNYDNNHEYIDSYPVGYDEWAESASWTTSVIHIQSEPYIEQESVSWEDKENSSIEILQSGKFKVTKTAHSKHEM